MFQGRNSSETEQDSTEESDTHQRVYYVLDRILETVPEQMRDHPMARMLRTFAHEGKKDLKRIPGPFIEQLAEQIGEAFTWVAKGKMADLEEPEEIESGS